MGIGELVCLLPKLDVHIIGSLEPGLAMNANGIANGPMIAAITPQNTGFAPRDLAMWWHTKILAIFSAIKI